MSTAILCEACKEEGRKTPSTWRISGLGPNCDSYACCGWDEDACDAHRDDALRAMPASWNLVATHLGIR